MPKRSIAIYIEPSLYNRLVKAKAVREKLSPPGWKTISSYAAHLLEEGLNLEEKKLEEESKKHASK